MPAGARWGLAPTIALSRRAMLRATLSLLVPGGEGEPVTRLRLVDGVDLEVDNPVEQVREALQLALSEAKLLEVNVGDTSFVVNPQLVLYLQDLSGSTPGQV